MFKLKPKKIRKDYSNQKFGRLLVLGYAGHHQHKDSIWRVRCDCGVEKLVRLRCLRSGTTRSCGCLKTSGHEHPCWRGHGEISKNLWNCYRHGAEARGLTFEVSIEHAWNLYLEQQRRCAYTGWELTFNPTYRLQTEKTASLDRIDSSLGYIDGNVQWVHRDVNKLKKNLSHDRFLEICHAIAAHTKP